MEDGEADSFAPKPMPQLPPFLSHMAPLWKAVRDDPEDFEAWKRLISTVSRR